MSMRRYWSERMFSCFLRKYLYALYEDYIKITFWHNEASNYKPIM